MITTRRLGADSPPPFARSRSAQYGVAGVDRGRDAGDRSSSRGQQPEMSPEEYLRRTSAPATGRCAVAAAAALRVARAHAGRRGPACGTRTARRRGRALFVFTVGIVLIVLATAFFLLRAVGNTQLVGVGAAATLLGCAMLVVAAGSLLPSVEDWFGARRELRIIQPLLAELGTAPSRCRHRRTAPRPTGVPGRRADVADLRRAVSGGHAADARGSDRSTQRRRATSTMWTTDPTRVTAVPPRRAGACGSHSGSTHGAARMRRRGTARVPRTGLAAPARVVFGSRMDPRDRTTVSRARRSQESGRC